MTVRVGINGFGRMGRLGFRAGWGRKEFEIVHINEISGDAACAAHLLQFDSVHGRWHSEVRAEGAALIMEDHRRVSYSSGATPAAVDWQSLGIDLLLDCTGQFKTPEAVQPYFQQGVRKVVVSAPVKTGALNVVMGVNDHLYDPLVHHIVTPASCTTNCLAPVVKVMLDGIGIRHGSMTTIHNITNTQTIIDLAHKDLRRARACSLSMIPTTTGSAKAITAIFPELTGKLNGLAVRIPLLNASLTDCVFEMTRPTTVEEVNHLLQTAAQGPLHGILGYETRPLVSIDFKDDPRSSIVDALSTMVINETHVKILSWYDNEWGYANRMMELTGKIAQSLS
ncbi:MAG: ArsJ-associated glyceraldehyde-3-phosphate dehydrogenase [Magnetococcus sp. YQC-5]